MYYIPKTSISLTGLAIGRKRVFIPCVDGSINYNRVLRIYAPTLQTEGGGLEQQQKIKQSKLK
jgi:hypothetical protein